MRLLVLAATNSWQGRIAGSRIACVGRPYHTIHSLRLAAILIPKLPGYMGGGHSQFSFNNDAFLYETASNFQISQSKNVP